MFCQTSIVMMLQSVIISNHVMKLLDNIFTTVLSQRQLKKYCQDHLNMVKPKEVNLASYSVNKSARKESFQFVSVLEILQSLLSHDDVIAEITRNSVTAETDLPRSYKDGQSCKQHPLFGNDGMALRLHLYVDDFEVCNPIGSRRGVHKLTAVYFVLGNAHPKFWSQSSSIHLAILARTKLVSKYGLAETLKALVDEINSLEQHGITVKCGGVSRTFFWKHCNCLC